MLAFIFPLCIPFSSNDNELFQSDDSSKIEDDDVDENEQATVDIATDSGLSYLHQLSDRYYIREGGFFNLI
jgi:hypothetical protein